jgi:aminopeptidase N
VCKKYVHGYSPAPFSCDAFGVAGKRGGPLYDRLFFTHVWSLCDHVSFAGLLTFITMKKIAVFILIVVFVSACSIVGVHFKLHNPNRAGKYPEPTRERTLLGDQDSKFRSCYDVSSYDINVFFGRDLEKDQSIYGFVTLEADVISPLDTIQLDAHETMNIIDVKGKSTESVVALQTLKWYRICGALFVVFPVEVPADGFISVSVEYSVTPDNAKRPPWRGGFVRKEDDLDNQWVGVACQSEGASTWWPCKDVVNDEPTECDIKLSVPNEYIAVSNGSFIDAGHNGDTSMTIYWWHVSYPINLYNITFYIGKYKLIHDTYSSKVTGDTLALNHYVLEQDYDKAKEHFKQLKDHLAFYEEVFGPYPFYRDGFKLVQSPYAGMEHQTAIAYGNKFKNNYYGFDYIILHETAHEWWGNSLTGEDLAEGWIHEGFATYAECLYVERTRGYSAYLQYLRNYKFTIVNRRPLVGVYGIRYFNYKDGDIYTKGAWTLHTLRQTINNDSMFFDIIKTFATRYMYKNVTTENFLSVVNEKTGGDYKWFFDQYCHNRFVPELQYYQDGDKFYYMWTRDYVKSDFKMEVVIKTGPSKYDTLDPMKSALMHTLPSTTPVEIASNILVKFTETKKVRKAYKNTRY